MSPGDKVFHEVKKLVDLNKVGHAIKLLNVERPKFEDKGSRDAGIQKSLFLVKSHKGSSAYDLKGALVNLKKGVALKDSWSHCQMARIMMDPSVRELFDPVEAEDLLRRVIDDSGEARFLLGFLHSSGLQSYEGTPIYDFTEASSILVALIREGEGEWYLPSIMKVAEISIKSPGEVEISNFEIASWLRPFTQEDPGAQSLYCGLLINELENTAYSKNKPPLSEELVFSGLKNIFTNKEVKS